MKNRIISHVFVLVAAAAAIALCLPHALRAEGQESALTILYSGRTLGQLQACPT